MKSISLLSIFLFSVLAFTSCKKELEPQESSPTIVTDATATAMPNGQAQIGQPQNSQMQMQQNMQMPAPVATAPGMNPPHGQPNHRCDLAVGAPLSTPVAKPATPQQNQVTTQVFSTTPAATVTPAVVNTDGSVTPAPEAPAAPAILQAPVETTP